MKQVINIGELAAWLLFGFAAFGLLEAERKQAARLRDLKERLAEGTGTQGFEADTQALSSDSRNVQADLRKAAQKTLQNVGKAA